MFPEVQSPSWVPLRRSPRTSAQQGRRLGWVCLLPCPLSQPPGVLGQEAALGVWVSPGTFCIFKYLLEAEEGPWGGAWPSRQQSSSPRESPSSRLLPTPVTPVQGPLQAPVAGPEVGLGPEGRRVRPAGRLGCPLPFALGVEGPSSWLQDLLSALVQIRPSLAVPTAQAHGAGSWRVVVLPSGGGRAGPPPRLPQVYQDPFSALSSHLLQSDRFLGAQRLSPKGARARELKEELPGRLEPQREIRVPALTHSPRVLQAHPTGVSGW